jgi:predicted PurR-regulated permease PerM
MAMVPLKPDPVPDPASEPVEGRLVLHIPWITFFKIGVAVLVAGAVYLLWPLLLLVFLALFLAVTLHAFVEWLENKGVRHWASLTIVLTGLLVVLTVTIALILPLLIEQVATFAKNLPTLYEQAMNQLPVNPQIRDGVVSFMASAKWEELGEWMGRFLSAGGIALSGLSQMILLLIIAIYMLIDGKKSYDWFLAFFSPLKRAKLRLTSDEISKVIFGYVSGQVITSILVTVSSYIVLRSLQVPGALMLAIVAGLFDILPILGFFIAMAPAFLLALNVSPQTAGLVLMAYLVIQTLENYLIVPMVYGKNLRVSTLTVLLGLLAGTLLAGIPGALAALPVIASYGAIERIWLKPFLREGVSEKHDLQNDQVFGERPTEG